MMGWMADPDNFIRVSCLVFMFLGFVVWEPINAATLAVRAGFLGLMVWGSCVYDPPSVPGLMFRVLFAAGALTYFTHRAVARQRRS